MINYFKIGTNITYRNLRQKIVLEQSIIRCCYSTRKFIPKIMVNRKVLNVTTTSYKSHDDDPNCIDPKNPRKIYPNEDNRNQTVLKTTNCSQPIGNWDGKRLCTSKSTATSTSSSSPSSQEPPPPNGSSNRSKLLMCLLILGATAGGIALAYNKKQKGGLNDVTIIENVVKKKKKEPASAEDIPKQIPYLLIGGGTASFSAFRAIKSNDPKAKVMVISNEYETPYMRPPLSKELWFNSDSNGGTTDNVLRFKQWNGVERSLYYEPNDFYVDANKILDEPNGGVTIIKGYTVKRIDAYNRKVILSDGTEIEYQECLLATGSIPKTLDVFNAAPLKVKENVSVYKTIEDFERLKQIVDKKKSIAIVGGGFLGSELACALVKYGESKKLKVFQVFHEDGNMGKVLPKYLSQWTSDRVREEGVCVIPNVQITSVSSISGQIKLSLINGEELMVDHVVVAVGSKPNIAIARESDLEIDSNLGGFVVNAELEARGHLYVAGDAACFYDPKLGRRRVEHHDHAVVSGRLAGENMVGQNKPYKHQSMFWSDLGPKIGYEAIGLVDSALETVGVFAISKPNDDTPKEANRRHDLTVNENESSEQQQQQQEPSSSSSSPSSPPSQKLTESIQIIGDGKNLNENKELRDDKNDDFGKGIIFYLRDNKVVGIVLWNVFNRINVARKIIGGKYDDLNEVAKLFDIHE